MGLVMFSFSMNHFNETRDVVTGSVNFTFDRWYVCIGG